jgi:MFS family permease
VRARLLSVALAPENRKWWTLLAVSFGLFMQVDQSELEWVVVAYMLTFASFLLTGGKLADMLGRRRLFEVAPA